MNKSTAMELYEELRDEIDKQEDRVPTLKEELERIGPIPPEGLYLGTATDDKPVLLNINEKFHLFVDGVFPLDTIKKACSPQVETLVISKSDFYSTAAGDKLLALASWIHGKPIDNHKLIVFIKNFDLAEKQDFYVRQNLNYILLKGKLKGVTVITYGTQNPDSILQDKFGLVIEQEGENLFSYMTADGEVVNFFVPRAE